MTEPSWLDRLECRSCGTSVSPDGPRSTCPTCGGPWVATYRLEAGVGTDWFESLPGRVATLWRYRELLPIRSEAAAVSLGEPITPVLALDDASTVGGLRLMAKDDGGLPTGSFKARGMAVAVSRARELGLKELFVPSAGNAGVALSAYGARASLAVRVYLPVPTPFAMEAACRSYGAEVVRIGATIREAGEAARVAERGRGSFDMSTLREPYRVEGKKTMGLELADQLRTEGLPEAIVYPTGGGTGLIGMFKAFSELRVLGVIDRIPRLIAVQPDGCAPVVRALRQGDARAIPWEDPRTVAPGLLVPAPFGSDRILEAVRGSGGTGVTVTDAEIREAVRTMARRWGLNVSPEAAAPWAAIPALRAAGAVRPGERVLLYLTGSGLPFLSRDPAPAG